MLGRRSGLIMINLSRKQAGFTLIEVLVALIILAIALVAVMKVTHSVVYTTDRVRQQSISRWVAMNVLSEMQIGLQSLPTGQQTVSGEADMLGNEWSWESGIAQGGSDIYERVYINVFSNSKRVGHLEGFVMRAKTHAT